MNSLAKMLCANFIDCKLSDFTLFVQRSLVLEAASIYFHHFRAELRSFTSSPVNISKTIPVFFSKACSALHVFPSSRYPHANSSKNFHCDRVEVSYYSWCSAMLELSLVNRTWDNSQADGCWLWMGGKSLAVQCRSAIMYIVYIIVCTVYTNMNKLYIYCIYYYFYTVFEYNWYMFLHSRKLIMEQWTVLWRFNPAGRSTPEIERMDTRIHGFAKGISFLVFAIFGVILGKSILS